MTLEAKYEFEAIGTKWVIDTKTQLADSEKSAIARYIESFDRAYSRFRDDSLVHALAESPGASFTFPPNVTDILDIYDTLNELSEGKINPLAGGSLEALGYDAQYSLRASRPLPAPNCRTTLVRNDTSLSINAPAVLDIGAIGKGYLVDALAAIVAKTHKSFVVDGSGDIAVCGDNMQRIGLEHPSDPSKAIGVVTVQNASLCGSGIGKRTWGKGLHHIIDATTGLPTTSTIIATWAIAPNTVLADALTTGLFFIGPAQLREKFGNFDYVIMHNDGRVVHNLPAETGVLFI
jgi:thiamine biosynthesis lipoprotein